MLYEMVKDYAGLGIHRTGTAVDRATSDWLESHLRARGAQVIHQKYNFDFFDAKTTVVVGGCEIPSMPLYYEAIAKVNTDRVAVAEFADGEHGSGLDDTLEAIIDDAVSAGYEALVIATCGETGDLVAINCEPVLRNRIPVILVPGRYADALEEKKVIVEYTSIIRQEGSTNITGNWGASSTEPPFVLTTPISGWFNCAGERGTGIAVALHLAERLSEQVAHVPLQIALPSGHELGFYGAYRLAETVTTAPGAVLHLGSCIAARDARMQGIIHADKPARDAVQKALAPMHIAPQQPENNLNPDCWVGESRCWAEFGMPMLSLAGVSPLFHTPGDIAESATTPELLNLAADCIARAALALIQDRDSD
jgi:hypothetical protein